MTTVYGVWSGYEDMDGIFSTKAKAEEYVRRAVGAGVSKDEFSILSYVIDAELRPSQEERKT